jgi:hypothetical protein
LGFSLWSKMHIIYNQVKTLRLHPYKRDGNFFLIGIVGGGIQLGPLGTAATNGLLCSPGWLWWRRNWWNDWQGKPKYSEKTCPSAALSTTNTTCCPDANPGRRSGKPASNRLSYCTALMAKLLSILKLYSVTFQNEDKMITYFDIKKTTVSWIYFCLYFVTNVISIY